MRHIILSISSLLKIKYHVMGRHNIIYPYAYNCSFCHVLFRHHFVKEGMLQSILSCYASRWIILHHLREQIDSVSIKGRN